jgi:ABC-type protease/lipase transport system fused ATPase/permease subunit
MTESEAILRVEEIFVGFPASRGRIEVLAGISLALARGAWTTCVGPSGR